MNFYQKRIKLSFFLIFTGLEHREQQIKALQYLLSLLPVPNRDTLWALLEFLSRVVEHSTDALDADGNTVSIFDFHVKKEDLES